MRARTCAAAAAAAVALAVTGCGTGGETDDLEAQLAEVTAERDALQDELDAIAQRYDRTVATQAAVEGILADPESYATTGEMVEALTAHTALGSVMDDDVFGAVPHKTAWTYTLGGGLDAEIETVQKWVDADGSESGSLWVWRGTNHAGKPFELIGISIMTFDDEGLITNEWVAYPYPDDFVEEAIDGGGTPTTITGEAWGDVEE